MRKLCRTYLEVVQCLDGVDRFQFEVNQLRVAFLDLGSVLQPDKQQGKHGKRRRAGMGFG